MRTALQPVWDIQQLMPMLMHVPHSIAVHALVAAARQGVREAKHAGGAGTDGTHSNKG